VRIAVEFRDLTIFFSYLEAEKRLDIFTVISLLRDAKALNDRLESIEISEFDFDRFNPRLMDPEYFERLPEEDNHHDYHLFKYHHEDNIIEHQDIEDIQHYDEHKLEHDEDDDDEDDHGNIEHHDGEDVENYEMHILEHDHEHNDVGNPKDDRSELR
jgi:hypothetical protein